VVSDKRSRVIDYYDIYHYESSVDYTTYSYTNELVGFDAEGQLTSAIEYVTMAADNLPVIYQITGHNEGTIGSDFEEAVTKANMTLSSVELLNEDAVPEDASAIIINAPQQDFNQADAQKVIDYLKSGGKAIIIGCYTGTEMPNFESILAEYDVHFTDGVIAENDAQHYYNMGGPFYMLPDVNYSSYTSSLSGSYIYLPATLGITYPVDTDTEDTEDTEDAEEDTIVYTSLMDTSDDSVSKNNPNEMEDYGYEEGDDKGPFSVGLAVEETIDDENTTQLLVFGSPYIFGDEASQLTANNATMFADVIGNMIPETESAGSVIPEKSYTLGTVTVSAMFGMLLGLIFTIVVPIILLILGIIIFVVRRKK
jgi:ABC-2 type transport system permease protein